MAVVDFEIVAALAAQLGPGKWFRDRVVEAQLGHLVGELEEEQVGDLLDVVAVTDPRVLEHMGVVPDFGDDGGGVGHIGKGCKLKQEFETLRAVWYRQIETLVRSDPLGDAAYPCR